MPIIYSNAKAILSDVFTINVDYLEDASIIDEVYNVRLQNDNVLITEFKGGITRKILKVDDEFEEGYMLFRIGTLGDPVKALGTEVQIGEIEIRSNTMYVFVANYAEPENEEMIALAEQDYFHFGVSDITLSKEVAEHSACFISRQMKINGDYLSLDLTYYGGSSTSVEVSILIGGKEFPIMPKGDTYIRNEKIFYGMPTRFPVDETKGMTVYYKGEMVSKTFEEAQADSLEGYSVSYYPVDIDDAKTLYVRDQSYVVPKYVLRNLSDTKHDMARINRAMLVVDGERSNLNG